jgi:hypothetical protein
MPVCYWSAARVNYSPCARTRFHFLLTARCCRQKLPTKMGTKSPINASISSMSFPPAGMSTSETFSTLSLLEQQYWCDRRFRHFGVIVNIYNSRYYISGRFPKNTHWTGGGFLSFFKHSQATVSSPFRATRDSALRASCFLFLSRC